jgi:hypothetical protein
MNFCDFILQKPAFLCPNIKVFVCEITLIMISGYHSTELTSVITLNEHKLCRKSRTREQSIVSIYQYFDMNIRSAV